MNNKVKRHNKYDPEEFNADVRERIKIFSNDRLLRAIGKRWFAQSFAKGYAYNFSWLGLPIIQAPQDIVAMQELIFKVKPNLIIETGIARGGSLIFYASLLALLGGKKRKVVGVDIDINKDNRINTDLIRKHFLARHIIMIEGSSVAASVIKKIRKLSTNYKRILVCLDSSHTHKHVLKELEVYSQFVSKGSYLVVFDTFAEHVSQNVIGEKPWGRGNNPATAVKKFLLSNDDFIVDNEIEDKIIVTSNPGGFLKRTK